MINGQIVNIQAEPEIKYCTFVYFDDNEIVDRQDRCYKIDDLTDEKMMIDFEIKLNELNGI